MDKKSREICIKLDKYRNREQISLSELARRLGVYETYIYRWRKNGMSLAYKRILENFLKNKKL